MDGVVDFRARPGFGEVRGQSGVRQGRNLRKSISMDWLDGIFGGLPCQVQAQISAAQWASVAEAPSQSTSPDVVKKAERRGWHSRVGTMHLDERFGRKGQGLREVDLGVCATL